MRKPGNYTVFLLLMLFISSCSNMKYISGNDPLYTGAKIRVTGAKQNKKQVSKELEKTLRPKPNSTILGLRPGLWIYNKAGEKPKGLKKWLKKKMGQAPVLLSSVDPEKVTEVMVSRLDNIGYFRSHLSFEIKRKGKKASVVYTAKVTDPYRFGNYTFPAPGDSLTRMISNFYEKNLLKRDQQYDLNILKQERIRIDGELKKNGYYFFSPEYLIFDADTTAGGKHVNFKLRIKNDLPAKSLIPYYINDVYISPAYSLNADSIQFREDTLLVNGYYYIDEGTFRPKAITRSVFLVKGERYNRDRYNLTIKRLMGMSVFSFVSIKFRDTINYAGTGLLDAKVLLTQRPIKSIMVEPDVVTKSNNYTGPALKLTFRNRNFLKGAELLSLSVDGNYEVQLSGSRRGYNSYEFGGTAKLYYPRFFLPFHIDEGKSVFVPKTKFEAGFRLIHRMLLFDMINLHFNYGYSWKTSEKDEFEIDPVALNFSKLIKRTDKFNELIRKNTYLRRSFEEQFTFGSVLSYTHNGLLGLDRRNMYYINGTLDVSGNSLSLIQSLFQPYKNTDSHPYDLFGYRYSQYTRVTGDGRHYYTFDKNNRIASRLMIGVGIPYGNSRVMPYLKQFFSGGANSIRAFLPRTVGPGSYVPPDSILQNSYFDQSGDIKLEANVEYRFTIISFLKGAVFLDAGNVWLMRADTNFPGGEFHADRFLKQVAVGTGIGLRIDISLFVIRFDIGMPLRKPTLAPGERWVLNKIDFGMPRWRRDNLVLNIAIGYPF